MKVVNGTSYHAQTANDVIDIIENARAKGTRVRVHYGDANTGKDWGDIYDVSGRVSRSTGSVKIPLLIHNVRSLGGGGMLDACIVRIRPSNRRDGGDLYRHPKYHLDAKSMEGFSVDQIERHFV